MSQAGLMHPRNLLTQAIDQAHAIEDDRVRAELLEGLAHVAIAQDAGCEMRMTLELLAELLMSDEFFLSRVDEGVAHGFREAPVHFAPTYAQPPEGGERPLAIPSQRWAILDNSEFLAVFGSF